MEARDICAVWNLDGALRSESVARIPTNVVVLECWGEVDMLPLHA